MSKKPENRKNKSKQVGATKPQIDMQDFLSPEEKERLERISRLTRSEKKFNAGYSKFIKVARLALALCALVLITLVFTWEYDNSAAPQPEKSTSKTQPKVTKNEFLKPRFESVDRKNQPYTVTAAQAKQDEKDSDLIHLQNPTADMMLSSGHWVAAKADTGTYQQVTQKVYLKGHVSFFHDQGYELRSDDMSIDLSAQNASTHTAVNAQGPQGTLKATGLDAHGEEEIIRFTGPAKLTLTRGATSLK